MSMLVIDKEIFLRANLNEKAICQHELLVSLSKELAYQINKEEILLAQKVYSDDLKKIQDIRNTFRRKKYLKKDEINPNFHFKDLTEFYEWYIKYDKIGTCCYCGVSQNDSDNHEIYAQSKRGRGKKFEVERVETFTDNKNNFNIYNVENCRLVCHICNNAKSDFLSVKDFRPIACGINSFWEAKLGKKIDFPQEVYNTFFECFPNSSKLI